MKSPLIFLLLLALGACQRPVDDTEPPVPAPPKPPVVTPPPKLPDSMLLKKMSQLMENGDTIELVRYFFDDEQRPKEQLMLFRDLNQQPIPYMRLNYFYQGKDTLPWLILRENVNRPYVYETSEDSIFLKYSNGVVSWDSIIIHRPDYFYDRTVRVHRNIKRGDSLVTYSSTVNYTNGEIQSTELDSVPVSIRLNGNQLEFSTNTPFVYFVTTRYNNHVDPENPFIVKLPWDYESFPTTITPFGTLRSFLSTGMGAGPTPTGNPFTINYTYRPDGYPLKAHFTWEYGGSQDLLYQYW